MTEYAPGLTDEEKAEADRQMDLMIARMDDPTPEFAKTRRWREKTGWPLGMRPDGTMNVVDEDGD